jgi:uncharacterized protein (TIGR03437 family)
LCTSKFDRRALFYFVHGDCVRSTRLILLLLTAGVLAGCSKDSTAPDERVSISAQSGTVQFGVASNTLAEPLQAIVTDPVTKRPLSDITVTWRIVQGSGATLTPPTSTTGSNGVATTSVRLGADTGRYVFEATAERLVGSAARFEARAVLTPRITSLAPRLANAGDTITITGSNFSTSPDENSVLFGGMRGRVVSATTTQLRVAVPLCLPTRSVPVVASLGAVTSNADSLSVRAATSSILQMSVGQSRILTEPRDLECQRFTAQSGLAFLIVPQNISEVVGSETLYQLVGLAGGTPSAALSTAQTSASFDFASSWELRLRSLERQFRGVTAEPLPSAQRVQPEIGDRRAFKVFDKNERFANITAEIKFISQRAIIFQDVNAPTGGFTTADFQSLGASFDSPTYETAVAVFGQPGDIDANEKIIILLTPLVNELTPRQSGGFVAGFFFGCDLQTTRECSGSNLGEMFYGFVPDPTGQHSDPRSREFILRELKPVVAHEFQHMIAFAARRNLDALWLSEGLAHHAEDVVADVYAERGDATTAAQFRAQNHNRAVLYLRDSTSVSLIAEELPGTLELRGGAWLLVKYLAGHYGGNTLLRKLTQGPASSVQNVTAATAQAWSTLMSDWAVALWADDAPELALVPVKREHTFTNINLRSALGPSGNFPLRPANVSFGDFVVSGRLRASSQRHVLMRMNTLPGAVNLAFSGQRGGPFSTSAVPQVTILRVQ